MTEEPDLKTLLLSDLYRIRQRIEELKYDLNVLTLSDLDKAEQVAEEAIKRIREAINDDRRKTKKTVPSS